MKTFKQFSERVISNDITVVFSEFDPPSNKHDTLMQFASKVSKGFYITFVSESGTIPLIRRLHYLNILYPNQKFETYSDIKQTSISLLTKYKSIQAITNEDIDMSGIDWINIPLIRECKESSLKLVKLAKEGDWNSFKQLIPFNMRFIESHHIFNDIRIAYKLSKIKL